MTWRKFVVEIGVGVDHHGQDPTKAARRAVRDAISRVVLAGLLDLLGADLERDVRVEVLVGVPRPGEVRPEEVASEVPIGSVEVRAVEGGLSFEGVMEPEFGDTSPEVLVAVAAVTVWVRAP
ncbi:MAG: hypothetical protein DRO06_03080 [Thermoproteota archaeon]|nr:MAG: hypothetical protein DRO06_03080 [Candidatus Korarchaeota archaeon]